MRWLLITTLGTNPGDEFVRIGIQRVIREVDPEATFDLLNKEDPTHYDVRDFDKAVWCGMPLFWSSDEGDECTEIYWWEPLMRGWPSARKEDFLVMGVGQVFVNQIRDFRRYTAAIQEVIERAYAVTARQPIIDHPSILDTVCPSVFTTFDYRMGGGRKLCNLMVGSGHFPTDPKETEFWNRIFTDVISLLKREKFEFVAHTPQEAAIGDFYGFEVVHIFKDPEDYLSLFREASCFFGHRLHAAVPIAARGKPAWGVAYDSRLKMLERVGGIATRPSGVNLRELDTWISGNLVHPGTPYNFWREFDRAKDLLMEFMKA